MPESYAIQMSYTELCMIGDMVDREFLTKMSSVLTLEIMSIYTDKNVHLDYPQFS